MSVLHRKIKGDRKERGTRELSVEGKTERKKNRKEERKKKKQEYKRK